MANQPEFQYVELNGGDSEAPAAENQDQERRPSEETLTPSDQEGLLSGSDTSSEVHKEKSYLFNSLDKHDILPRFHRALTKILLFLLPSFISPFFTADSSSPPPAPKPLHPTAWLDGLRGIACTVVVVHHFFYSYTKFMERAYDGVNETNLLQLPIIKMVHHGSPMVKIFFIISGFALTAKAVKITYKPKSGGNPFDLPALLTNLFSSVFKRYLRLYIPCAASFLLAAILVWAGALEVLPVGVHPGWVTGWIERRPPMKGSLLSQLNFAFWDFYQFGVEVTFFGAKQGTYMTDNHLWTIPVEYGSSITLFVIVTGCCLLKRWIRVYLILPFLICALLFNRLWGLSLFVFGYFLGELHFDYLASRPSPIPVTSNDEKTEPSKNRLFRKAVHITMMIIGLYLFNYPYLAVRQKETTGYQWLMDIVPPKYSHGSKRYDSTHDFWQCLGSMLITWSLMYMPQVQDLVLKTGVIQYFGKISFSLYIMHAHTHKTWGHFVVKGLMTISGIWAYDEKKKDWVMNLKGNENLHGVMLAIGLFLTMPMTIYAADVFWRAVDLQSVRFLRWVESKMKV